MRNFLYIVILFLSISACKRGVPGDIIQPEKMSKVLADIHVIDGYISSFPNADSARVVASSFYNGIYKKYEIDSAIYAKSMVYYNKNPQLMDQIYTTVVADLTKQKNAVQKADSIANAKVAAKARLKLSADSLKKADSLFKIRFLLKDTTKKKINFIQPKLIYKEPKF